MPQRRKQQSSKQRHLLVAYRLLVQQGRPDAPLSAICRELDIQNQNGFTRHFGGKFGLLQHVDNMAWGNVNKAISDNIVESEDPRETILSIARSFWSLYETDRPLINFILHTFSGVHVFAGIKKHEATISEENDVYINRIETLCTQCVEKGLVQPQLTARTISEMVFGFIEGVFVGWYFADNAEYLEKITIEEALQGMAHILSTRVS